MSMANTTKMECCMHVVEKDGRITPFTDTGWKKFTTSVFLWKDLGTRESTVAEEAVLRFKLTTQEPAAIPAKYGYHRDCYSHFTNVTNIRRAQRRFEKAPLFHEEAEKEEPEVEREAEDGDDDGEGTAAKTQALSSHTSDLCTSERAPHLLPVHCIICKHEKYKRETYTRKRMKEKLIQCGTLTAGKLLLAAEGRKDESLLLHIRDRDLVASEARYHFTCFRDYTRYLSKKTNETESNLYENGYKYFCESVIEERLLRGREVLRLCRLNMLFKDVVRQREGLSISSYKAHSLKARLQKSHPFLKFQKAPTTYFVYVDDLTAEEIFQEDAASSSSSSSSDSEAEGNDADTPGSSHTKHNTGIITKDSSRLLYHAALTLRDIIHNTANNSPELPWPPAAEDLTHESTLNMVPDQLFNFVARTCGISLEPSDNERVEVTLEDRRKIVSTCQDIITLSTKGT